jgi:integrase/recombinase XerD
VKFEKVPLPPAQSLTPEQMQQVWEVLEFLGETKQRDTALLHILSHGLRAGEIVDLNVSAFDGQLLFLADTKTGNRFLRFILHYLFFSGLIFLSLPDY